MSRMIPLFKVSMNAEASEQVSQTLNSGFITQGPKVEEFEDKLKTLFDYPYLVSLNSATSGLVLALRMIKDKYSLPDTTEVLTTPLTCMATNEPILTNNLQIKWVDVDPETCNIDLKDLEAKITNNTKILLFVHWAGTPVDLDALHELLDRKEKELGFRIQVIEDCAHAMLAEWNGKKVGTFGNYAVFSLQAIKHLTTGDGGVLMLPSEEEMERAKLLRWFGIDRNKRNFKQKDFRLESDVESWGYKFHMNDINATIGLANLQNVNGVVAAHRANGEFFNEQLKNIPGITALSKSAKAKSSYWIYTLLVDHRDEFIQYMTEKNITVSSVHKRNDVHSCFSKFRAVLPQLDALEQKYVCIPVGWWLTQEQLTYIVDCIKQF